MKTQTVTPHRQHPPSVIYGQSFRKRVILVQLIGFICIALILGLDEILDLPHLLFGVPATPINVAEAVLEISLTLLFGGVTVAQTYRVLRRIRFLEGILPTCCGCNKMRDEQGEWLSLDTYLRRHADAELSHGLCPDCMERLYPEIWRDIQKSPNS